MEKSLTEKLKEMTAGANKIRSVASMAEGDSDKFIMALGGMPDKIISMNPTTSSPEEAKEASASPENAQEYLEKQNKLLNVLESVEKTILPR